MGSMVCKTGLDKAVHLAGSQAKLASMVGVSQQAICEWVERGYLPLGRIDDVLNAVDPRCRHIKPRDLLDPSILELVDRQLAEGGE